MTEFTYTILSSVPREEIIVYFHATCQKIDGENDKKFIGFDYQITLGEPQANPLGHFTIWHTPVHFSGPKESVLHQVELFRTTFLSAGG